MACQKQIYYYITMKIFFCKYFRIRLQYKFKKYLKNQNLYVIIINVARATVVMQSAKKYINGHNRAELKTFGIPTAPPSEIP